MKKSVLARLMAAVERDEPLDGRCERLG